MSKSLITMAIAALATSAFAKPLDYKLVTRQSQGTNTTITMGQSTLNWGSGSPPDVIGQALGAQCVSGSTQCDQSQWSQVATVCSDNSDGTTCTQQNIDIVCAGQYPDENMRQALVQGLGTAAGQNLGTADVTIAGTGGGAYSAYYPGSEFTAYTQASFIGITVYDGQDLVAEMTTTITVVEIDDDWCGSTATDFFGAGGALTSAVGQDELSAVFGFLGAICG